MKPFEKKIRKLARDLFLEDCERINILYKLQCKEDKIQQLKSQLVFNLGYPNEVEIYEYPPFVLRVLPRGDVEIYTTDQFEKIEGFLND